MLQITNQRARRDWRSADERKRAGELRSAQRIRLLSQVLGLLPTGRGRCAGRGANTRECGMKINPAVFIDGSIGIEINGEPWVAWVEGAELIFRDQLNEAIADRDECVRRILRSWWKQDEQRDSKTLEGE